jgi:hypothetical protein
MVLGSGFAHLLDAMDGGARIPYAKLPGFPPVSVGGTVKQNLRCEKRHLRE